MKPDKVCRIIGACAVLHNIAIMMNEPLDDDDNIDNGDEHQRVPVQAFTGPQDGRAVRDHIARSFF